MRVFDLRNEYKVQEFREYVKDLEAKRKVVQVGVVSPNRSTSQNNYLHLVLGHFAFVTGYTLEEVKQYLFKRKACRDIFRREIADKYDGKTGEYWRSTKELSTAELSTAITRFRNWASAVARIYLPAPYEYDALLDIRDELTRANDWIEQPQNDNENGSR